MEINKVMFGKRLKEIRKLRNMTSNKLAEVCKIEPSFVRQIESAAKYPSIPVFVKLCNALRVSPEYLLKDSLDEIDEPDNLKALYNKLKNLTPNEIELVTDILEDILKHRQQYL
ncbi:helix-turn-helix transcriptional regulator [Clostridium sp. D2Q-14]|uniref:helix-turn-helix domain-containing protein n=1 Tax=Anaeromonas gelatinilytica TaxID=2683194 RepID=UPI00193C1B0A|nr:helix-turn-helix transcriptional regulator [Anaeromonas gelatinilytica]MBS4536530.1 helix-turn-helix transcriptional regulator [Anaeromonas gelatinilytica]